MHPNISSRRVHSSEFKSQILSECRQPGASISAVAIAHGLNTNVVRKWLAGRGLKRMGAAAASARDTTPALQFVPVELARSAPVVATTAQGCNPLWRSLFTSCANASARIEKRSSTGTART